MKNERENYYLIEEQKKIIFVLVPIPVSIKYTYI